MADRLRLQVILKGVDKITKPFKGIIGTSNKLQQRLAATRGEIKNLEGVHKSIATYKKFEQELGTTSSELDRTRRLASKLGKAVKGNTAATKKQNTALAKQQAVVKRLTGQHKKHLDRVHRLRGELRGSDVDTRHLAASQDKLNDKIAKAARMSKRYEGLLQSRTKFTNRLGNAQRKYNTALRGQANLSFVGGAGVAVGLTAARSMIRLIRPGIELASQMAAVGAVVGKARGTDEFAALKQQAMNMGASTSFTSVEVAQGMEQLARTGFKTREILASMPDILSLSRGTRTELGRTAEISSNIMSAMKIPATEMQRVADVLAATSSNSNVTLESLGETMKFVAPIAATLGMSLEEAAAMAGKLGDAGIGGSMGGTSFRKILGNIVADSNALETLDGLGIETTDAEGEMRHLLDILQEVNEATAHMSGAEQVAIMKEIAGQRAMTALNVLQGDQGLADFIQQLLHEVHGFSRQQSREMEDHVGGDILKMQSAFAGLGTIIHDAKEGSLRDFIQSITELIGRVSAWTKANPELIGQLGKAAAIFAAVTLGAGALALAVSAILWPFAQLFRILHIGWAITALFGNAIWFVAKAGVMQIIGLLLKWTSVQAAFNVVMAMNPIALSVIGIVAMIAAVAAVIIYWDELVAAIKAGWNWLVEAFPILGEIASAFGEILETIANMWSAVFGGVGSLWNAIFGEDEEHNKTVNIAKNIAVKTDFQNIKKMAGRFPAAATGTWSGAASLPVTTAPITRAAPPPTAAPEPITITVNAAKGMDENGVARTIRLELEAAQNERAIRRRGRFAS